jgi:prepilin-type N-terminal cleavage/methylation domain-containing protein
MTRGNQTSDILGRKPRAFTLVEVMVVVVIIGLLAAAGLPGYRHLTMRSKVTALENDLRQFSTAIQTYTLQNGHWPDSFDPNTIPADLAAALPANFRLRSPIGGVYKWNAPYALPDTTVKGAITIETVGGNLLDDDIELLEMIDRQVDDGSLTSGMMQDAPGALVYVIEK